jgi:hypothetical protein
LDRDWPAQPEENAEGQERENLMVD